jgi:hypothetical protein
LSKVIDRFSGIYGEKEGAANRIGQRNPHSEIIAPNGNGKENPTHVKSKTRITYLMKIIP